MKNYNLIDILNNSTKAISSHAQKYLGADLKSLFKEKFQSADKVRFSFYSEKYPFLNVQSKLSVCLLFDQSFNYIFCIAATPLTDHTCSDFFPEMLPKPPDVTPIEEVALHALKIEQSNWLYIFFSTEDVALQNQLLNSIDDQSILLAVNKIRNTQPDAANSTLLDIIRSSEKIILDNSPTDSTWNGGLYFTGSLAQWPFDSISDSGILDFVKVSQFVVTGSVYASEGISFLNTQLILGNKQFESGPLTQVAFNAIFLEPLVNDGEGASIGLNGALVFSDSNSGKTYELDVLGKWPLTDSDLIELKSVAKLSDIPFFDHNSLFGIQGQSPIEAFEFDLMFSKSKNSIESIDFSIELDHWEIITDVLKLKSLKYDLIILDPFTEKFIISSIDATASLGKNRIELDCGSSYPEGQFYFRLNPDTPIHLHDMVAAFFGNHGGLPEHLEIKRLDGQFNYTTKDLSFSLGIDETVSWTIANEFELKNIRSTISSEAGAISAKIDADFKIGQVEFKVSASFGDGWSFDATCDSKYDNLGVLFKELGYNSPKLPDFIRNIKIDTVELSFKSTPKVQEDAKNSKETKPATKNTEKHFKISGSDKVNGTAIQFELKLNITYPKGKENIVFSGHMTIEDKKKNTYDFDIIQQKDGTDKLFLAAYHQENPADSIDIGEVLAGLGVKNAPSMDLSLQDAFFVNNTNKKEESKNIFVADIGTGMNLSNLPLVGKILPKEAKVSVALRVLYASTAYAPYVDQVNKILPTGISPIAAPKKDEKEEENKGANNPANGKKELELIADINIGEQTYHLDLDIPFGKSNNGKYKIDPKTEGQSPESNEPIETTPEPNNAETTSTAAPDKPVTTVPVNDGITWFKIGKKFGPIVFNRIGLAYKNKLLSVYPDAAISMGGLSFTLNGLSVSSPIKEFKPTFDLKGLGLDFAKGPIEIGASFLRRPMVINDVSVLDKLGNPVYEYDGMATIKTEPFSISALGSYTYVDNHASLFIYAYLERALGGPAFFFVEGLAAAFGYNRSLLMPTIDQVSTFPLVRQVMDGEAPGDSDPATLLTEQLEAINHYIPPSIGQMFFAIGVKFNSFKLIDSFALLAVSFGNRVEIDLLGQSNIIVPSEVPPDVPPLAEIKIQLMAKFIPEEGFLAVQAQLSKDSYIFDKDCHLTGGAAFYSWFKNQPDNGAKAGDFVVTMGGYHPDFIVPSYYPHVPRLGLNWQVCPELSVKGDMYFALCAHAFMAGGHLEANYESGPLKAWFKAGADFLISWQPYHYDAEIYLDLGASYTYHLFGTHQITLDLGADVHIWGPEFAGTADIHILIFDIAVAFGPQGKEEPAPISWDDFKQKCLPDKIEISVAITQGQHGQDENKVPLVNPKDLTIKISSPVPIANFITHGGTNLKGDDSFSLAPMEVTSGITSEQIITITKVGRDIHPNYFIFTPEKQKMPAAIWGNSFLPDLNTEKKTIELVTGLKITTKQELNEDGSSFDQNPELIKPLVCSNDEQQDITCEPLSPNVPVELLDNLGLNLNTLTTN